MAAARRTGQKAVKVTDEAAPVRCVAGEGLIREEVWEDAEGNVIRYNLTFINFYLYPGDNGRVLGYDTAHGYPHRHFAGTVERIGVSSYEAISRRFIAEVAKLKMLRNL
jgi:hypothetical protein